MSDIGSMSNIIKVKIGALKAPILILLYDLLF